MHENNIEEILEMVKSVIPKDCEAIIDHDVVVIRKKKVVYYEHENMDK